MWCLAIQAAVAIVPPHAVVLQDVQHPGHLTEDEHTRTWKEEQMVGSVRGMWEKGIKLFEIIYYMNELYVLQMCFPLFGLISITPNVCCSVRCCSLRQHLNVLHYKHPVLEKLYVKMIVINSSDTSP